MVPWVPGCVGCFGCLGCWLGCGAVQRMLLDVRSHCRWDEAVDRFATAARRRISVDETSGVSAAIRMIRGLAFSRRRSPRSFATRVRETIAQVIECRAGARHDPEVRGVEDLWVAVPGGDFCKGIGAGDERQSATASGPPRDGAERVERVGRAVAIAVPGRKPPSACPVRHAL